jgi:hypothetical protein
MKKKRIKYMINGNELKEYIENLRLKASEIKNLQKENIKRRAIVIEFSGAPKAGKTACISSLAQFFKKNKYKVHVIHEAASICPVSDKHGLFFDLWTLCSTFTELIEILGNEENRFDIVLIDRGIFDALCWFNWLCAQGKFENKSKINLERLMLSDEIIKYIDIVFSFMVKPEISMQRKYANLLTDISGTIMNTDTLEQYNNSTRSMIEQYGKRFHHLEVIDTSDTEQIFINKEVTEKTLDVIRELWTGR